MVTYIKSGFNADNPYEMWDAILDYALSNYNIIEISTHDIGLNLIKKKLKLIRENLVYSNKEQVDKISKNWPRNVTPTYVLKYSIGSFVILYFKKELKYFFNKGLIRIPFRKGSKERNNKTLLDSGKRLINQKDVIWIYNDYAVYGNMKEDLFNLLRDKGYRNTLL